MDRMEAGSSRSINDTGPSRTANKYCQKLKLSLDENEMKKKKKWPPDEFAAIKDMPAQCHKMHLYPEKLLNKATEPKENYVPKADNTHPQTSSPSAKLKKTASSAQKPEVIEEHVIEADDTSHTGTFRDQERRIDLVLVVKDQGNYELDQMKINFLLSIIKAGFEIELEAGQMNMHKDLVFINIHAPSDVLEEYAKVVDVKKYFKHNHSDWIPHVTAFLNPYLFFGTRIKNEREWIDIVRQQYSPPSNYSTYERSLTVYKVLLQLPFGQHVNHFGLGRLLQKNIILDAYALHDGPYFYTRRQDFHKVNARQILFNHWVGLLNLFRMQPLNLIHEYLGSKIAFYFAFFQYYIPFLLIPAYLGVYSLVYAKNDDAYTEATEDLCKRQEMACPLCLSFYVCPFMKAKNFCDQAKIVDILDHSAIIPYCAVMVLWGSLFVVLWKRRERYWVWFWELSHVEKLQSMRPQFKIDYNKSNRSSRTGIWMNYNSGTPLLISVAFGIAMTCLMAYGAILYTVYVIIYKYTNILAPNKYVMQKIYAQSSLKKSIRNMRYTVLTIVAVINVIGLSVFEKICKRLTYLITNFENHRAEESYQRSIIVKQTVIAFACTFPILFYFGYFKVTFYKNPGHPFTLFYHINCGPLNCIDELGLVLMVTLFVKQIIPKVLEIFVGLLLRRRTDYNQGMKTTRTIPCWEREYRLKPLTENTILQRFLYLARQFGFILLFAPGFPLTAALAFIVNIFHIRHDAEEFLLNSRRPLLVDAAGIGTWNNVFNFIPYMAAVTNALIVGFTSRVVKRYVHLLPKNGEPNKPNTMSNWYEKTMTTFRTNTYYPAAKSRLLREVLWLRWKQYGHLRDYHIYANITPSECIFPGAMYDYELYNRYFFNHHNRPSHYGGEYLDDETVLFAPIRRYIMHVYEGSLWSSNYEVKDYNVALAAYPTMYEVKMMQCVLLLTFMNGLFFVMLMMKYLIRSKPADIEESIKIENNIKKHYILNKTSK